MIKIVTPLTNIDNVKILASAGADEFYCGFLPYEWLEKYNNSLPINRREILFNCNITSYDTLKVLAKMSNYYGKNVKITFNSHYYLKEQYPVLGDIISKLIDLGFNTFIIADLSLIMYIREQGLKANIHLSGEAGPLNRLSTNFYNQFDIERYVFPLKTTIDDMRSVIANNKKQTQYEAFMLSASCPFSGEYCNSIHCDELGNGCTLPYRTRRIQKEDNQFRNIYLGLKGMNKLKGLLITMPSRDITPRYSLGETGCGLCKIRELIDIGITHLKVNGRGVDVNFIAQEVENLKKAIGLAYEELDAKKYEELIKRQFYPNGCPERCTYPN